MALLNLIRYKNLLIIAAVQILIKYFLFEPFGITVMLNGFGLFLLILSTICLAAAGYIINDVYDVETDLINKPNKVIVGKAISEKQANRLFVLFNIIGVAVGFYLSHLVGKSNFFRLFVIISATLYVYASYLKQLPFVGNVVISILVGLSVLIVPIFDLIPAITSANRETQITLFEIVLDYAIFAFLINLIREMVKDLEDVDGDYKAGMNTLPIAIGRERATKLAFIVSLLPVFAVVYYMLTYLYKHNIAIIYFLLFVIAPLLYSSIKLFTASQKSHYSHISKILKIAMIFGMGSMILYKYILL
ncbi:MAG: prenyltransferase [Bacteroidetes bacterium MedPE-SWsnd-G2]|nr:MAG: prenyltransferase [Bacteroidetes bacterium MedPE-SWsnd-G2]